MKKLGFDLTVISLVGFYFWFIQVTSFLVWGQLCYGCEGQESTKNSDNILQPTIKIHVSKFGAVFIFEVVFILEVIFIFARPLALQSVLFWWLTGNNVSGPLFSTLFFQ